MEAAKLILEYLKVLIWPIVVICVLFGFSGGFERILGRLTKADVGFASLVFGTGKEERESASGMSTAPDVWFDIRETSLRNTDCAEKAKIALEKSGFQRLQPGGVTYGYTERFVGAIWCGGREGLVLITVAGPKQEGLQAKYSELAAAFFSRGP